MNTDDGGEMNTYWDILKALLAYPGACDWVDADDIREAMDMIENGESDVVGISNALMYRREE